MKKLLLSLCLPTLLCIVFCCVSCSKKDEQCKCTYKEDGDTWTSIEFPDNYKVETCDEIGKAESGNGVVVTCTKSK